MIIRSQNKNVIMNMDGVDSIVNINKEVHFFNGGTDSSGILGTYSTEEKAIKVLDMIQGACVKCEALKSLSSGTMFEVAKVMTEEQSKEFVELYKSNFVFEMPQDSEV